MHHKRSRLGAAAVALTVAVGCLLALPTFSSGGPISNVLDGAGGTTDSVTDGLTGTLPGGSSSPGGYSAPAPSSSGAAPGYAAPAQATPPGYVPPLHGEAPHGEGTVASTDFTPVDQRPLGEETDGSDSGEDAVIGRSRGEESSDGEYQGRVESIALLGNSVGPTVETDEGERAESGLTIGCAPTDLFCLQALRLRSETTDDGSENSFTAARLGAGGAQGAEVAAAESEGNINEGPNCQRSNGASSVASASLGGASVVNAAESSSSSTACNDGTETQSNDSQVLAVFGTPVLGGCSSGVPNTELISVPPLLTILCNADDSGGSQTADPYGVREALTTFVLDLGSTSLNKTTLAASESAAQAPGGDDGPDDPDGPDRGLSPDDSGGPGPSDGPDGPGGSEVSGDLDGSDGPQDSDGPAECEDGVDNDGDGQVDFPDDPECLSAGDDSESDTLAFTGANVIGLVLIATLLLAAGLALRRPARPSTARS